MIVLIISNNVLKCPYLRDYISFLDEWKKPFKVISWNRLSIEENSIQYNLEQSEKLGSFYRWLSYLKYVRFILINLNKLDAKKVIIFSIPLAMLLAPILKIKHIKYVLDIRDRSKGIKYFRFIQQSLIKNSVFSVISSPGFADWLPQMDKGYVIDHNCSSDIGFSGQEMSIIKKNPIRILTIGTIRYFDTTSWMIKDLKNNSKFSISFVGEGPESNRIRRFCDENNFHNCEFYGRYLKSQEAGFVVKTTFINCLIDLTLNSKTCMSNRIYLSAQYGVPIIVERNTYQARVVAKYNLGCIINERINLDKQLENYLHDFKYELFEAGCRSFLEKVRTDKNVFKARLNEYCCEY